MDWTVPYPCRSRRDSVRRINMSSEPGNESFFCALRPILRILSLQRQITRIKVKGELQSLAPTGPRKPEASPAETRETRLSYGRYFLGSGAVADSACTMMPVTRQPPASLMA
jgi:hypothetical protein